MLQFVILTALIKLIAHLYHIFFNLEKFDFNPIQQLLLKDFIKK